MKAIPWYEWHYSATMDWLIYSHKWKWKYLKNKISWKGYHYVILCLDGVTKNHYVHRLIMLTYYWYQNLDVNHINWIKIDNRIENLEYCTRSQNQLHAFSIWLNHVSKKHIDTLIHMNKTCKSKKIGQYTLDWKLVREWSSMRDPQSEWFQQANIWKCCQISHYTYKWFRWRYH